MRPALWTLAALAAATYLAYVLVVAALTVTHVPLTDANLQRIAAPIALAAGITAATYTYRRLKLRAQRHTPDH